MRRMKRRACWPLANGIYRLSKDNSLRDMKVPAARRYFVYVTLTYMQKPLNPVLGETFHGHWDGDPGTTRLVAEQVSHHPPISAYSITTPNGVVLQGHNGQKSGFSGRTITVKQVGHATMTVPVGSGTETYLITLPQLSLEGLFFGAPYAELMDKSYIVSTSGWIAEHDYSGRGWLSGAKNTMKTKIYPPEHFAKHKKPKYVIEGQWNEPSSLRVQNAGTEERKSLFDIKDHSSTAITVDENDLPYESRRLWSGVASALTKQDYEAASKLKSAIESDQRKLRKDEAAQGKTWERRYFEWHDTIAEPVSALMHAISAHAHGTWTLKQVSAYGLPSSS